MCARARASHKYRKHLLSSLTPDNMKHTGSTCAKHDEMSEEVVSFDRCCAPDSALLLVMIPHFAKPLLFLFTYILLSLLTPSPSYFLALRYI